MASGDKSQTLEMREEKTSALSNEPELAEALRNYVPRSAEEKKLVRKIDLFLMPILWIMYVLNYVDRTNIVSISARTTASPQKLTCKLGQCQNRGYGYRSGPRR